jgi:quercetin dioxygenase-like cupin family protein
MRATSRLRCHAAIGARTAQALGLGLGLLAAPSSAAPPASAPVPGPDVVSGIVLENDRVRAHALTYPPGALAAEHAHPYPRVVVVLAGGTLEIRDAAPGQARRLEVKEGEVVWRPAERHAVANVGTTIVRLVEIDLLDATGP